MGQKGGPRRGEVDRREKLRARKCLSGDLYLLIVSSPPTVPSLMLIFITQISKSVILTIIIPGGLKVHNILNHVHHAELIRTVS